MARPFPARGFSGFTTIFLDSDFFGNRFEGSGAMELSVSHLMVIIGALLIVAVLLDGYRRVRNENRHRIKVSLSRQAYRQARNSSPVVEAVVEADPGLSSELPNGGARVIGKSVGKRIGKGVGKSSTPDRNHGANNSADNKPLQLDQSVPVLLESVEIPPQLSEALPQVFDEPEPAFDPVATQSDIGSDSDDAQPRSPVTQADEDDDASRHELSDESRTEPWFREPELADAEPLYAADEISHAADDLADEDEHQPFDVTDAADQLPFEAAAEVAAIEMPTPAAEVTATYAVRIDATSLKGDLTADAQQHSLHEKRVGLWEDEDELEQADEVEERRSPWHGFSFRRRDPQPSEPVHPGFDENSSQEVLAIYVVARDGEPFKGQDLLQLLLACDLRFGKMNIFHRHEKPGGRGAVQFSVANIAEPGTFDLDRMEEVTTTGVCLFLVLPGPEAPYKAFDYMVETAQVLVKHLDGELRDDAHSALTRQTLEHCRQRIRDFERKQLTLHL